MSESRSARGESDGSKALVIEVRNDRVFEGYDKEAFNAETSSLCEWGGASR